MNNQFTYSTRTGNKMRTYVKVAIWIFVLVAAIGVVAAVNRNQMVSEVMATPRPLDSNLNPTETAVVAAPIVPVEGCPSDPASWTLSDQVASPGSNLKVIAPQCVYDNLEKTAAWVYATTALGYTRADTAAALGLQSNTLITNLASVTVLTDFNDQPQSVEVISAVNSSKLAEWRVNANGGTGLEMSFSGCFSTSTLTGGQIVSWGNGYPVVCQFFADYRTQYVVSDANGKLLTIESAKNVRRPMWFGYIGNGNWTWIGSGKVWDVDLSQIPAQTSTLTASVMAEKYGLTALPLPQNWQTAVGQEYTDAFLAELKSSH
jgi:hypothetical protein